MTKQIDFPLIEVEETAKAVIAAGGFIARDADGCPVIYKEALPDVKATATLVIERFRRAA